MRLWAVRILNSSGGRSAVVVRLRTRLDPRPARPERRVATAHRGGEHERREDRLRRRRLREHQPGHPSPGDLPLVPGGITVVAAAANASRSAAGFVPAAYNEAITVSALADTDGRPGGGGGNKCYSWGTYDRDDTFADFSNYGSDVDLIAPGKCILSTKPGPTYAYSSGTSMAAPHVTGAVALYKASRPLATPAEVRESLRYLGNLNWYTSHRPRPVPRAIAERVAHRVARARSRSRRGRRRRSPRRAER